MGVEFELPLCGMAITFTYRSSGECLSTCSRRDRIAGALQWYCRGQRFDPVWLHHKIKDLARNS
jgi:hypothetical protein